jgi:hypothetical protein
MSLCRFAVLIVPLLWPALGPAQQPEPLPPWRVGGYLGLAFNSPGGDHLGTTTGRNHLFLGIRATTSILRVGPVTIAYAAEFLPAVVVWPNPTYATVDIGLGLTVQVNRDTAPVWGVGVTPLGLEAQVAVHRNWRAFAAGGVGCVQFTRSVPVANARAFNYTLEYGGGVLWEYRPGRWVQVGFKFHHLSNLYSARSNPGLDANVFYVGWHHRVLGGTRRAT